jgi:hypothetical protein
MRLAHVLRRTAAAVMYTCGPLDNVCMWVWVSFFFSPVRSREQVFYCS